METYTKSLSKKDKITLIFQLLLGVFTVIVGVLFIFRDKILWSLIYWMFVAMLAATILLFLYRSVKNRSISDALIALGSGVFLALIIYKEALYIEIMALFFGIWALFNALVHGLEFYVAIHEKQKNKLFKLFASVVSLIMGIVLLTRGVSNRFLMNIQIGSYVIFFGIVSIISSARVLWRHQTSVRLSAPVFLAAMNPYFLVKETRKLVQSNPDAVIDKVVRTEGNYISIYIYAKDHGYNRMGHLDIGYNGVIYSYGAHDPFNRAKSMAYGDGVMIVGSEVDYVQYAVDDDTTVFRFICELSDEQREFVENRLDELFKSAYYFKWPYQLDTKKEHHLTNLIDAGAAVDYYKFKEGEFKTYNVFTTNCVLIADYVIQSTGMKLFQMSGVITPGAYYDYLDNLLNKPGSIVVKREIYRKKEV
ncbi:hypothetical protein PT167_08480 [Erysipelothrix rhusiopathiae]|nr:hypothetical protein [Erysipelothrix rhusiopathiae]